METLAELLEHELEDAVQIKNKESLHRYISLLTQNYLKRETFQESIDRNHREHQELRSDIQLIAARMEEGFKRMDERFTAVDKRFESIDKRFESMDKRFESVDRRFESMEKQMDQRFEMMDKRFNRSNFFLGFGFTGITALMTLYQFLA